MAAALYHPEHGYYTAAGGRAGRRGDFLTSPEVGPLFGAVLARALDGEWERLGRPAPFTVVEAGAGAGTLAVAVRAAGPACARAGALRYVLVERSPALRARHADHLPVGAGASFVSAEDLPGGPVDGVVVANELLDNLPVRLLERGPEGWYEVHAGVDPAGGLVEELVPADGDAAARAAALAPGAGPGDRLPLADAAAAWVVRAREQVRRGALVLFDYGDRSAALAARPATDWLRTYREHERGGPALAGLGGQDITCEVPLDQLPGLDAERQAGWLGRHGLHELVAQGRRAWHDRTRTDLAAIRGRSRVHEADALTDPSGLGAFWALTATVA